MANNYPYIEHTPIVDIAFSVLLLELFKFKTIEEVKTKGGFTLNELLKFAPFLGPSTAPAQTNEDRIKQFMDDDELQAADSLFEIAPEDVIIKSGTTIVFPGSLEKFAITVIHGKVISNIQVDGYVDFESFLSNEIKDIINDERYAPKKQIYSKFKGEQYRVTAQNVEITVLVWSRALERVINLSPFVVSLDTTVSENGGQFNISLPPLTIPETQSADTGPLSFAWDQLYQNIVIFKKDGKYNYSFQDNTSYVGTIKESVGQSTLKNFNPHDYAAITNPKRILDKNLLFNTLLSHQDMVFIKFERLIFDDDNLKEMKQFELLNLSDTNGQVWDMIGLVDQLSTVRNEITNDYHIQLQGKDLMKLLIQDGVYVFPLGVGNFQESFVANSEEIRGDDSFDRLFGEVQDLALHLSQPIKIPLEFVIQNFSKIEVIPDKLFEYLGDFNPLDKKGVWRLTELTIDDTVKDRLIVDSGLASNLGSLINFVKRICQPPFVEFFGDTYGDKYHFVVRKPPLTKDSILSNFTINIDRENVLNLNLGFNDANIYSWYRLNPMGSYFGDAELAKFFLPAVYFPEYAKIWGANPMEVTSNYLYYGIGEDDQILDLGYKQSIEDLKFIIQSNAYNPFVRTGSITINPDRRIKYGMNIYLNSTDEIFRVQGVTQSYSISDQNIERITNLTIGNGMVLAHIDKYFDVIELPDPTGNDLGARKLKWKVNKEIFDFLLRKKQFYKNLISGKGEDFKPFGDETSKKGFFKPNEINKF